MTRVSTLTCHLVTRNPAAAAAWYGSVLGAVETSRITLPGGQVMTIELRFGDSTMAIVISEMSASTVMSVFAQWLNGMTSVGLKAVELVKAR